MTTDCADVRAAAPELALGLLSGDERGAALAHLATCAECRVLVEQLSEAADSLLLLGPEIEPPLGFESRVAAGLQPAARTARQHRWWRAATVAAALATVAAAGAIGVAVRDGHPASREVRVAELRAAGGGAAVGEVYLYRGTPAWVFMSISSSAVGDTYACELDFRGGRTVRLGTFDLNHGERWWGRGVKGGVGSLEQVRLLRADGTTAASAQFS
jgi:anti-sigma-K factor RskA